MRATKVKANTVKGLYTSQSQSNDTNHGEAALYLRFSREPETIHNHSWGVQGALGASLEQQEVPRATVEPPSCDCG